MFTFLFLFAGVNASSATLAPELESSHILPHLYLAKPTSGGQPVKFVPYGYYKHTAIWLVRPINVCWNMGLATYNATRPYRHQITAAIASSWSKVSTAQFVGWRKCGGSISNGFGITAGDVDPHTNALGSELNGNLSGMTLNFTYASWSPSCASTLTYCNTLIAMHEFGHALGLSHEQNRPDTPRKICNQDPQGENGDVEVGKWDLASIMNYCNPSWNGNGNLSAEDIQTIQLMYGAPEAPKASPFDLSFGPASAGDCVLQNAKIDFAPNGTATWTAQVKTNHTHSGDYWHATLALRDASGNVIQNIPEFTSMRMSDDHGFYPWQQNFAFNPATFTDIRSAHLHSSC